MNTITIELSTEDRARLDKLTAALNRLADCNACISEAKTAVKAGLKDLESKDAAQAEIQEKLKATVEKAKTATATKSEDVPPWEAPAEPNPFPEVTLEQVQGLTASLVAAGKKEAVRAIVQAYAPKVSAIPADKLGEAYAKMKALEG